MIRETAAFLVAILCAATPSAAAGEPSHATTVDILSMIREIKETRDVGERDDLAYQLHTRFSALDEIKAMDGIGDRVIDALIGLLDDSDDLVRGYAAEGLGQFGKRAQKAVPALERALWRQSEADKRLTYPVRFGIDSIDYIVPTLKSVQGIPQNVSYETGVKLLQQGKNSPAPHRP